MACAGTGGISSFSCHCCNSPEISRQFRKGAVTDHNQSVTAEGNFLEFLLKSCDSRRCCVVGTHEKVSNANFLGQQETKAGYGDGNVVEIWTRKEDFVSIALFIFCVANIIILFL